MRLVCLATSSPAQTRRLGKRLGKAAQAGDVFLLQGPFGAGKTVLVQGLAEGMGVAEPITSPSYVIITEHRARLPFYHIDLYRVEAPEVELLEALEEYLSDQAVMAVEWSERLPPDLRRGATVVELAATGARERSVRLCTPHERLASAAAAARRAIRASRQHEQRGE